LNDLLGALKDLPPDTLESLKDLPSLERDGRKFISFPLPELPGCLTERSRPKDWELIPLLLNLRPSDRPPDPGLLPTN
jgi:hypothetical protein